jgi:hypothetical protein
VPGKNDPFTEALNIPRTIETTGDLSYTLRQAFILAAGHPVKAAQAMGKQLAYVANVMRRQGDRYAFDQMNKIQSTPEFAEISRLKPDLLTHWDSKLGPLEEGFLASRLGGAPIIKQSNHAAVLFLNQLRYSVAKDALAGAKSTATDSQKKALLDFIGAASGRGNFPEWLDKHANTLAGVFYSPRFTWSRFESVAALPKAAITRNPLLAKEAARDLVASYVAGRGITELARLNGAKVESDETSPDWGKIQVGNTRVDVWGGFQPIARLLNQAYEGRRTYIGGGGTAIDQVTGMPKGGPEPSKFSELMNKYRPEGAVKEFLTKSIYGKFIRSKEAPVAGFVTSALLGQNYSGQPFQLSHELAQMITPLGWQDIYEAIADDKRRGGSGLQGGAAGAMSLLGAGVQTIPENNTNYPLLPEIAVGGAALLAGQGGKFNLGGTTTATPTPKPSPKKGGGKTSTGTNPFGR